MPETFLRLRRPPGEIAEVELSTLQTKYGLVDPTVETEAFKVSNRKTGEIETVVRNYFVTYETSGHALPSQRELAFEFPNLSIAYSGERKIVSKPQTES